MRDLKVSIILPCFNQWALTRQCLQSLFKYTRPPYQLILIDNGSTDQTGAGLKEIKRNHPEINMLIVRNRENKGAPKAFNQGISKACGRYFLFLNNDTLVTEGWLEGLIGKAELNSRFGIIGACSNKKKSRFSGSDKYAQINKLAALNYLKNRGKYLEVPAQTSFCLLVSREVVDQIGMFDENYGLGTNDDHDFCLRARQAGYKIVCALDVFVYHFYHKTLGKLDMENLDRRNREYFVWKFGRPGLRYYAQINQPYGLRGERSFASLRNLKTFQ